MIAPELSRRAGRALLVLQAFERRDEFIAEVERAEEWELLRPWAQELIELSEENQSG